MIKHIVMWTFAEEAEGADKATNLQIARDLLTSLSGVVPGIITLEPVIGADPYEHTHDLLLYSEFESAEALAAYQQHSDHLAVGAFIKAVCTSRVCVDYPV